MQIQEPCYADPSLFLMADEALVESAENATFRICAMEKSPDPVLLPTQPWEGGDGKDPRPVQHDPIDGTVLYDAHEGVFHLWYRTHNGRLFTTNKFSTTRVASQASQVCYATSADGFNWERPNLGLVPFEQSFANNMFKVDVPPVKSNHLSGVVPNYCPDIDANLIATVHSHYDDPVYPIGITFLTSRDGLHWTPHWPPSPALDGDAHCLMYDWHQECYICTTRSYVHAHEVGRARAKGCDTLRIKRHVAVARSRDMVHWTPMMCVHEADDLDPENAQLYYMYIVPYGHGYVGFVQMFYMAPGMTYGPLDMQLTFSRDLLNWTRVGDRTPILPRGPEGVWDMSHVSLCTNPPHPEGDRLRFWYGGKDTEHWQTGSGALGTATLRRDGFACYEAGDAWGVVTTAPFEMQWATKPAVSADAAKGEIRVEMIDADTMEPLEGTSREDCRPITGDDALHTVRYGERRGTFVRHSGKVRFRIYMRNAKLYALRAAHCKLEGERPLEKNLWR